MFEGVFECLVEIVFVEGDFEKLVMEVVDLQVFWLRCFEVVIVCRVMFQMKFEMICLGGDDVVLCVVVLVIFLCDCGIMLLFGLFVGVVMWIVLLLIGLFVNWVLCNCKFVEFGS